MPYYVDDIVSDDQQQRKDLWGRREEKDFPNIDRARAFTQARLIAIGAYLKIPNFMGLLNGIHKKRQIFIGDVTVEYRHRYKDDEARKNGIYVYKGGNGPNKDNMIGFVTETEVIGHPLAISGVKYRVRYAIDHRPQVQVPNA